MFRKQLISEHNQNNREKEDSNRFDSKIGTLEGYRRDVGRTSHQLLMLLLITAAENPVNKSKLKG